MRAVLMAVAIGGLFASCSDSEAADATGVDACIAFEEFNDDVAAGVLTPGEFRARLQDVVERAESAQTPGLAEAARDLLAAATQGEASPEAVAELSRLCARVDQGL